MNQKILNLYGNRIRVRSCGILLQNNKALLIKHVGLNQENEFWNFPGGGQQLQETLTETLVREFDEEVKLKIKSGNLCFVNEVLSDPLHAIEFYFEVFSDSYDAELGHDPELNIITDIKWFNWNELLDLQKNKRPRFLDRFRSFTELTTNKSFENIVNG